MQRGTVAPEKKEDDQAGITPRMYRSLVVRDHKDFSSNQQQDAYEFYQHLLKFIQQRGRASGADPTKTFEFQLQQRLQCTRCQRVRYNIIKNQSDIALPIPHSINDIEGEKAVDRAKREATITVPFGDCLKAWAVDETVDEFNCPQCKTKTIALK
jgi:ubiquitin carboxyl-terminal hydrolase 5/13